MSGFSFSLREADPPSAVVAIGSRQVSAASFEWRGAGLAVRAHASEVLPEGALTPSLNAENVRDRAIVQSAVRSVLERIGRPRRIGLVIPDPVAKVSLVKFEQVPARVQDLEQLIRWQVKKSVPFAIDDAQVSYAAGIRGSEGQEFLVTCARREAVLEYEDLCQDAGAHAGIVDLSTLNVTNMVLASSPGLGAADWLLINIGPEWASTVIIRNGSVILFRSRGIDGDDTLAELAYQSTMYFEDRLAGAGFARVVLAGASHAPAHGASDAPALRRDLQERLGADVQMIDPMSAAALTDRITAGPDVIDALAPLVGMALRGREAVA